MLAGFPVGWFAPTYKYLTEVWQTFVRTLRPVTSRVNSTERRIELITGGVAEFWTLDDPDAGRSRKYKRVVVDEAAKAKNLEAAWNGAIRATLTDFKGDADFYSTPKGRNFFWKAFVRGQDENEPEWGCWQLPTVSNPFIDPAEVEAARKQLPDRIFRQEYLAEFLDDAGGVFRNVEPSVDKGRTANDPPRPGDSYVVGVDLARVEDFTVIAVVDGNGRQAYHERFNQISWSRQIEAIKSVAARYPGAVVVDSTGVGDPVCEALRRSGVKVVPYHFSNASKEAAVDRLALLLEQDRLRLMDVPAQTNELLAYEYELTPSRNVRMSAPEGMHDDCVMALALAAWGLGRYASVAETPEQAEAREAAEAEARAQAQAEWMSPFNDELFG